MGSNLSQQQLYSAIIQYDPYEILGVPYNSSGSEIKKAYHKKAKKLHSDRLLNANLTTEERMERETQMRILNEVYKILKDPETRSLYDNTFTHTHTDLKDYSRSHIENQNSEPEFEWVNTDDFNEKFSKSNNTRKDKKEKKKKVIKSDSEYMNELEKLKPKKIFGKRFDTQKFNALFEHYKKNSDSYKNELIKIDNPESLESCDSISFSTKIGAYDGHIVIDPTERYDGNGYTDYENYIALHGNPDTSEMNQEEFEAYIEHYTKHTGEMDASTMKKRMRDIEGAKLNQNTETIDKYWDRKYREIQDDINSHKSLVMKYVKDQYGYNLEN